MFFFRGNSRFLNSTRERSSRLEIENKAELKIVSRIDTKSTVRCFEDCEVNLISFFILFFEHFTHYIEGRIDDNFSEHLSWRWAALGEIGFFAVPIFKSFSVNASGAEMWTKAIEVYAWGFLQWVTKKEVRWFDIDSWFLFLIYLSMTQHFPRLIKILPKYFPKKYSRMKSAKNSKKLSMLLVASWNVTSLLFGHFLTSFLFPDCKQIDVGHVIGILLMSMKDLCAVGGDWCWKIRWRVSRVWQDSEFV